MTVEDDGRIRCGWIDQTRLAPADFVLYRDYHDTEWGQPLRDSAALFERISLEAFQSGLSWLIILRKRENFRRAFHGFDVERIARYTKRDIDRLMADTGIVRNRRRSKPPSPTRVPSPTSTSTSVSCCGRSRRRLVRDPPICPRSLR